ncbi:hypothetical protein RDWZM_004860 [Blomia tropicalis]|uniref:Protein Wnt n=1 Tax=Blomia tropicalis TaxID=40697 RepID=A0A9Q0M2W8_BLOTA|nr:hypothetical protein RDWZM_004860 [Blomia tropicalis]
MTIIPASSSVIVNNNNNYQQTKMPMTTTTATITAIHDNDILSTNHINHNNNQQLFSSQQSTLTKDGHSNENDTKIISTSTTIHRINNNANRSNWWILGTRRNYAKYLDITPSTFKINCHKVKFLNEIQREMCSIGYNVVNIVGRGARIGIDECQHQFKMNRWNCSTYEEEDARVFGPVLDINSREKAFIHAISTAGVVYSITRACSRGEMSQCGCDETTRRSKNVQHNWEWGGCSDDIHYGAEFTKKFIDSVEDPTTPDGLVNLHNNEVGRRVIKSKMELICKCHGMSGSCTIKVCWRKMKPFREVGQDLSSRFDGATHVKVIESRKKRSRLRPAQKNVKKPSKRDLVFLEESPDFCFKNLTIGAEGTTDRICNATSYGLDGCRYLCCGRGYRTIEREIEAKCNCKFVWCCNVVCDKCRSKIVETRCN